MAKSPKSMSKLGRRFNLYRGKIDTEFNEVSSQAGISFQNMKCFVENVTIVPDSDESKKLSTNSAYESKSRVEAYHMFFCSCNE